jgi:hypothetical protein
MNKHKTRLVVFVLILSLVALPAFCKNKKSKSKAKAPAQATAFAQSDDQAMAQDVSTAANDKAGLEYISKLTGMSGFSITKVFKTGFESMNDFKGFYVTPLKHMNSASYELAQGMTTSGSSAFKAWIFAPNPVSGNADAAHRAYMAIQMYKTGSYYGIVFAELSAWVDVPLTADQDKDWISLASFCTYSDDMWLRAIQVNLNKDDVIQLTNVPVQTQAVDDIFQAKDMKFPMKQWVKISVLMDFGLDNEYKSPYVKVWQDEKLASAARFNPRIDPASTEPALWPACLDGWDGQNVDDAESLCGLVYEGGLAQAHFGLYAAPLLSTGTVYNDDLAIYELTKK